MQMDAGEHRDVDDEATNPQLVFTRMTPCLLPELAQVSQVILRFGTATVFGKGYAQTLQSLVVQEALSPPNQLGFVVDESMQVNATNISMPTYAFQCLMLYGDEYLVHVPAPLIARPQTTSKSLQQTC